MLNFSEIKKKKSCHQLANNLFLNLAISQFTLKLNELFRTYNTCKYSVALRNITD